MTTSEQLFQEVDVLNELWKRIEKVVFALHPLPIRTSTLSIVRLSEGKRLVLTEEGKPLVECSTEQKIKAVDYLIDFGLNLEMSNNKLTTEAKAAIKKAEEWLLEYQPPQPVNLAPPTTNAQILKTIREKKKP